MKLSQILEQYEDVYNKINRIVGDLNIPLTGKLRDRIIHHLDTGISRYSDEEIAEIRRALANDKENLQAFEVALRVADRIK